MDKNDLQKWLGRRETMRGDVWVEPPSDDMYTSRIVVGLLDVIVGLQAIVDKLPDTDEILIAIGHIEHSIQSHEEWAAYRRRGGHDDSHNGDLAHHERCLVDYAQVIGVLRASGEAARAARAALEGAE